jgi:hypothetical protein
MQRKSEREKGRKKTERGASHSWASERTQCVEKVKGK